MTLTNERVRARVDDIRIGVIRLGSLVSGAVTAATSALTSGDLIEADHVIADDDAVDAERHAIEDECLRLLGGAVLDPAELRFVVTTMRVAHELERTADLMVNVARTTWRLYPHALVAPVPSLLTRAGRQVTLQLRVAVNAFVEGDISSAAALADMDETVDEVHDSLVRHALTPSDPTSDASVLEAVHLALVARHYERAGDHTVTIASWVPFVTGASEARARRRARAAAPAS
ncbi:MAG: phosphate signaling complex PhoU family protein [Acidimicrobiia bacterium]